MCWYKNEDPNSVRVVHTLTKSYLEAAPREGRGTAAAAPDSASSAGPFSVEAEAISQSLCNTELEKQAPQMKEKREKKKKQLKVCYNN
jgi:hypothetical protein